MRGRSGIPSLQQIKRQGFQQPFREKENWIVIERLCLSAFHKAGQEA